MLHNSKMPWHINDFQRREPVSNPEMNPIAAEPAMIHRVSRFVNAMKAKLAQAIAMESGPWRASCARGMVVEAIRPAAAKVNACIALRTAGRWGRAPS
jgi:hypothetical protein